MSRDRSLDVLLDLAGQVFVVDEKARFWVKFEVRRIEPTSEKPHGLDYSLTLHDAAGERLVGFDNAHAITGSGPGKKRPDWDHKHRLKTVRRYEYTDAAALLSDFWAAVDAILRERGIIP
jgi:hypothetical protein